MSQETLQRLRAERDTRRAEYNQLCATLSDAYLGQLDEAQQVFSLDIEIGNYTRAIAEKRRLLALTTAN